MDRKKLLIRILLLIGVIFVINSLANKFHWYFSIWYFDMPMHFLGGFWLGLLSTYLFSLRDISFQSILKVLVLVFFVGAGWEVFELYAVNYLGQNTFYKLDTISDVFFDLAGGIFAIFYVLKKVMSVTENTV